MGSPELEREKFLSERLAELHTRLDARSITEEERKRVEGDIDRFSKQRDQVYAMWTWPFGKAESIKYGAVLLGNLLVSLQGLKEFLDKVELPKIL